MKKRSPRREKPGQGERGWKPPRFGRDFRVALAFPGPYRAGMSSLGFQSVLYGFASLDGVLAERVFLDEEGEGLHLLDAAVDPGRVDLLAFSCSSEYDYPKVLTILGLSGIPLRSRDRRPEHPLVLAGGIAPSLNPEPLAEFMDFIALGEGEELLGPVIESLRRGTGEGRSREGLLEKLAPIEGIYVPSLYRPAYDEEGKLIGFEARAPAPQRVSRRWVRDLAAWPVMSRMVAPGSEFEDLCLLEVNRGCGRGCRFCAAGHLMKPLRHRPLEGLLSSVEKGAPLAKRFGLLGSAVGDHPDIVELAGRIVGEGRQFSLSSLRIDRLSPELLEVLRKGGCRTVTLAPETGSERLRRAVGKRISDGQILEAVGRAARAGIPNLKLYFMIGLPTEDEADRAAIPDLLRRINGQVVAAGRSRGRLGTVSVSLSCFVPKAWTPFQWHPFEEVRVLKKVLAGLTREIRKIPNTTVSHDLPKRAYVQALLSRGDRRTADILEKVHLLGGNWSRALKESPLDPDFFVYRQRDRDEIFPWDFIETGLNRGRLWKEYRRALAPPEGAPS
jgi:radical SAM superfamily enzyme YgiQ (UPF0313 family)